MYADLSLDHELLKEVKKVLKPSQRREGAVYLVEERATFIERACRAVSLHRSMWYYQSKKMVVNWKKNFNNWPINSLTGVLTSIMGRLKVQGVENGYYGFIEALGYNCAGNENEECYHGTKNPLSPPIRSNII